MQNDKSSLDLIHDDHDLHDFQQRAVEHEINATRPSTIRANVDRARAALSQVPGRVSRLPRRYILHLVVLLMLPLGLVIGVDQTPPAPAADDSAPATTELFSTNENRPLLGLAATTSRNEPLPLNNDPTAEPVEEAKPTAGNAPISDPDFDEALIVPVSRPAEPEIPSATINVEKANLRNGPGTNFDALDKLPSGTKVTLVARHEGWVEVRTEGGQNGWLALEVVDVAGETADALPAPAAVPAPPPARVATVAQDNLNLRDGPGTEYVSVKKLANGTELALVAQYNGWLQVETPDGVAGWVTAEFLSMQDGVLDRVQVAETIPSSNPALVGWISQESVNLRSGPNTKFSSLGKMAAGTELALLAKHNDWLKVTTPKGTTGWISAELVDASAFVMRRVPYTDNVPALPKPAAAPRPVAASPAAPAAAPAAPAPAAPAAAASGDVAALAWQFVGARYVWGGESPSGFDCSGLTRYLYRQVGVNLPHNAAAQYSSRYGTFVSGLNNLQPGDLLFYVNTAGPGITHVGIYVGNGMMVNAMTPASGVGAVSIYSNYWLSHYYGALRPYR